MTIIEYMLVVLLLLNLGAIGTRIIQTRTKVRKFNLSMCALANMCDDIAEKLDERAKHDPVIKENDNV